MHSTDTARAQPSWGGPLTHGSFWVRNRQQATLNLVPMIDIFTVLVTFLLMTAVFSRITILQLDLPSAESTGVTPPSFRLEVIVRDTGFELTNGQQMIAAIPKVSGDYDFETLTGMALALKRDYPDASDASVLLEREVPYDYLIQVMDAIRSTTVAAEQVAGADGLPSPTAGTPAAPSPMVRMPLFTDISVGEAP